MSNYAKLTCLINDYRSALSIKKIETFAVNSLVIDLCNLEKMHDKITKKISTRSKID